MSANWTNPISTTLYTSVLSVLDERLDDAALMFNGLSPTNLPTGAWRIDGSSNNLLQTWSGSAWANEKLSVQTLLVGADGTNADGSISDILLGGNANIASPGHLKLYIDSDNNTTDRVFGVYKNAAATTSAVQLLSLGESGAMSVLGAVTAPTFVGALTGNATSASTVTTNANLVGQVTSAGNTTTLRVAAITGQTLMASAITGTDELLMSDSGVIKRSTFARVAAYVATEGSGFPTGTVMLFHQSAAPTGWTKTTAATLNDHALRIVTSTAWSSGSKGTVAFSTVFGRTASDGYTLVTADVPAHTHNTIANHTHQQQANTTGAGGYGTSSAKSTAPTTSGEPVTVAGGGHTHTNVGGGGSHSHGMDIRTKYANFILATKD